MTTERFQIGVGDWLKIGGGAVTLILLGGAMHGKVQATTDKLAQQQVDLESLDAAREQHDKAIVEVQRNVADIKEDMAEVQGDVGTIQEDVQGIENAMLKQSYDLGHILAELKKLTGGPP